MKDKRVLITTYQSAFLRPGGGEAELKNLVDVLHQMGINADIYGATSMRIEAYDIVLHFSVHGESFEFIKSIKAMGKKVILWPNLWWAKMPDNNSVLYVESFLRLADVVIFKSLSELNNVSKYVHLTEIDHLIVPWHIDKNFLLPVSSDLFRRIYGLNEYLLWVGVIEASKNQYNAIQALNGVGIPLVFIGYHRDNAYFQLCRQSASAETLFLPYMEQGSEVLRSAYKGCTAYIELSSDPAGLSALEAALYEKPMILGKNDWSEEEFGDTVALVDVFNFEDIKQVTGDAINGKYQFRDKNKIIKKHLMPESLDLLVSLIHGIN